MGAVATFVATKLIPALGAIQAALPGLLSQDEADVSAAINAIVKVIGDLQTAVTTLITAVKSAT